MIQIAFYKSNQPRTNNKDIIISWWTGGIYSHVELIIGDDMYSSSPRDGGVRKKKHCYDPGVWDYVKIKNVDISKILTFYEITKDTKYDWLGILGFIIPFKDRENRWFCSEWVSNALKISGYKKLWTKEPSKISPNKLFLILTSS